MYFLLMGVLHLLPAVWSHGPPEPPDHCVTCPFFLNTPLHVNTSVGAAVNLTCGIRNLGDSKVSWIRKDDLHVLTTELMTYTSDKRYRSANIRGSPFWTLEVNDPKVNDTGLYECQVSSQPKLHRRITLVVTVPVSRIMGSTDVFMKAGSDINITCVVTGHARPTHFSWHHLDNSSGVVVEMNSGKRGGVQVITDRNAGTSVLVVSKATHRDGGKYTCRPEYSTTSEVIVHILHDEEAAAMQPPLVSVTASGAASNLTNNAKRNIFLIILYAFFSLSSILISSIRIKEILKISSTASKNSNSTQQKRYRLQTIYISNSCK